MRNISVCGEVEALRALLAAGADVTITDLNGGSPVCIYMYNVHLLNFASSTFREWDAKFLIFKHLKFDLQSCIMRHK